MSSNNNDDVPNETATQASLEAFFTRFTFPGYQYNSQAPPEEEFRRLLEARKWGERRAAFFHRQFLEAGTSSSPLVIIDRSTPTSLFFIAQQSSSTAGYEFQGRAPEVEFGDLVRKEAGQWRRFRNMLTEGSESRESREGERYKGTSEYEQLRRAFHAAVEQEFDWLLENQHGSEGERSMKPWEYLVVLFKVGQLPISKKKALKLLKRLYMNIFDVISYLNARRMGQTPPLPVQFPTARELGQYSSRNSKVYPLEDAKENGTLRLFLARIRRYFSS